MYGILTLNYTEKDLEAVEFVEIGWDSFENTDYIFVENVSEKMLLL
jgi:hypothetical protein